MAGRTVVTTGHACEAAVVAVGAAGIYLVGHDGSPGWRLARVLVVGLLAVVAYRLVGRGGAVRATTAFVTGCLAVAVGVGIGVPYLDKAGAGPMAVAGLVCLVSGLLLVGVGGGGLVRLARGWWRLPVVLGLLLAVGVTVMTIAQPIAATNVPPTALDAATPASRGLAYRDVTFRTADGVTLSGWYVPSANGAAIALLHGSGSTRSSVLSQATVLARHGYGVLLFDARGHGRSGGRAMDFGWYGDQDTSAAVSFLAAQAGVDPGRIGAMGMSMGGEEAIGAAAADDRIRAVVAEGATNRVPADKAWLSSEFGWRGTVQRGLESVVYGTADLLSAARPPIALRTAVAQAHGPVLLIAAGTVEDESLADRFIAVGSPETVDVWVVPGAAHTGGLRTAPAEWERRTTAFLDTALAPVGP